MYFIKKYISTIYKDSNYHVIKNNEVVIVEGNMKLSLAIAENKKVYQKMDGKKGYNNQL